MIKTKCKCRVSWNKPYRTGTICNYVDEVTNECYQEDRERCPCGGIVRVPAFPKSPPKSPSGAEPLDNTRKENKG